MSSKGKVAVPKQTEAQKRFNKLVNQIARKMWGNSSEVYDGRFTVRAVIAHYRAIRKSRRPASVRGKGKK